MDRIFKLSREGNRVGSAAGDLVAAGGGRGPGIFHILDMGEVQVFTNLEEADSAGGTGSGGVVCDKDLVDERSRRAGAIAVSVGDEDAVAHAANAIRRVVVVFSQVDRVGPLQPGIIKLDARDEREDVRSRIKDLDAGFAVSLAAAYGSGELGVGSQT